MKKNKREDGGLPTKYLDDDTNEEKNPIIFFVSL